MKLVQIGTTRIPRDRRCDHCDGEYPDIAIKTDSGIFVYHSECVRYVEPQEDTEQHAPTTAEQLKLFDL